MAAVDTEDAPDVQGPPGHSPSHGRIMLPGATEPVEVEVPPEDNPFFEEEDTEFVEPKPTVMDATVGDTADSRELGVTLAQLQEYLAISLSLNRSCRTLPLTIALWICYLLVMFYHSGTLASFESADLVRQRIEDCYLTWPNAEGQQMHVVDISDHRHIIPWIDEAFVPVLQAPDVQVLLGFVRVWQRRGEKAPCGLDSDSENIYGNDCFPGGGSVGTYGPVRPRYVLADPAFQTVSEDGNEFEFWLEVNRSNAVVSERVNKLSSEGWIDLNTQEVKIEGLFLNVEEHIYSHFSVAITLHREGYVESSVAAFPLRADIYSHWSQVFVDVAWICLFLVLMFAVISETLVELDRGLIMFHLKDPYFWLDICLAILGTAIVVSFYIYIVYLDLFTEKIFQLGVMPPLSVAEASVEDKVGALVLAKAYQEDLASVIDSFSWFVDQNSWIRFCSVIYSSLMVFRFFRGFTGQPRIAVLVQTFLHSAGFVFHFLILLAYVFAVFALGGYILFGEQLEGWNTPTGALNNILLVFFMKFDYGDFHDIEPIVSALWFTSFFLLAVLLLQRLITAAIVHAYMSVRASLGEPGDGVGTQAARAFQDLMFSRSYRGSKRSIPFDELLHVVAADADPAYIKKLGNRQVDRRLRTRADLAQAEASPSIDVPFLVKHGCDQRSAERLLRQCAEWTYSISLTSSPLRRLLIMLVRQMHHMRFEAEKMQDRMQKKFDRSAKVVDRIDLKHAKCLSLARRIRKGQQLPPGWTVHTDADGRRYLRQEETGLTSWTLPKHLL